MIIIAASIYAILFAHIFPYSDASLIKKIHEFDARYYAKLHDFVDMCYDGGVELLSCNIIKINLVMKKGASV